ncbi:MAG TPA: YqgE/AlgH family protein [Solirubrobacterales bacterium]|nr:YqgE/AlgH family protein [Solirubrobacterales bacterium]
MADSLSGQLLIASPSMSDQFRRAVVLMIEHNEEGAFGLVLNQPSDSTVGEVAGDLGELIGSEHVVHVGGPVQPNAVTAIGEHSEPEAATKQVLGAVGMVDLDDPPELHRVRVFAGYAGWGPGQLDAELEAEAWIVEPARPDDVFAEGDLWADVLERMGGEYALLARMPLDPSLN